MGLSSCQRHRSVNLTGRLQLLSPARAPRLEAKQPGATGSGSETRESTITNGVSQQLLRGAAYASDPGLRGRVIDIDDSRAVAAVAVERAGVTGRAEHALALQGHLLKDDVLGLGVSGSGVIFVLPVWRWRHQCLYGLRQWH